MANTPNNMPATFDTDFTSFRAIQTLQTPGTGVRAFKVTLVVGSGGASSAGSVQITEPNSSIPLFPPLAVTASIPANSLLFGDNLDNQELTWRDFGISGLTATGTKLFLWYRL